jgi:IMP cyclohydrolase
LTSHTPYVIYRIQNLQVKKRVCPNEEKGDCLLFLPFSLQGKIMTEGYEIFSAKEYLGRIIIIGEDISGDNVVVIYVITGRSPSSQARRLEARPSGIWVNPLGEDVLKEGNVDWLVYPPILLSRGIAVSNGKQTADILACFEQSQNPKDVLDRSLRHWEYEQDAPTFTPRISGCILPGKKAALSLIKRAPDSSSIKSYYNIPLMPGNGKMIATYEGTNIDPLPSFSEEPVDIEIKEKTPKETARAIYNALKPGKGKKDFRVAVACVFSNNLGSDQYDISIINRHRKI